MHPFSFRFHAQGGRRAQQEGLANGKAKKGKGKRAAKGAGTRRRGGADAAVASEAGPPVAGAILRVDLWPADSGSAANATPEPASPPGALQNRASQVAIIGECAYDRVLLCGLSSRIAGNASWPWFFSRF